MSPERLEIVRNSDWLAPIDMEDVLRLTSQVTVARMLERDDFAKRYAGGVADLADGVPLPAAPGDRLGRGPRRRRARRHRPAVQPDHGPPPPGARRPGAAGRAHHAVARRPRRRAEDVEVARQLHRDRPSRRASSSASSCRSPTR